ncbi:hypothetical protein CIHG_04309 [Coccidioides immitis H538.4]|uniref:C2H2-type domain-containing protein n=1 Tax=Coccidioides immitis H538.4 TaxID=396776 RepID=A0A0J8RPI6_COCIT|nr:hypothetical protein CIHG_04309 [Coccidioides immitis H538.4]
MGRSSKLNAAKLESSRNSFHQEFRQALSRFGPRRQKGNVYPAWFSKPTAALQRTPLRRKKFTPAERSRPPALSIPKATEVPLAVPQLHPEVFMGDGTVANAPTDAPAGEAGPSPSSGNAVANDPSPSAPAKKPRRFHCKRCDTRFSRLEHLQRHERIHTQEKPFACQLCDHRFTRSDLLIRHERLSHNKIVPHKRGKGSRSNANKATATPNPSYHDTPSSAQPAIPTTFDDHHRPSIAVTHPSIERHDDFPLATLSMAAEHVSLQMPYDAPSSHPAPISTHIAFGQSGPINTTEPPSQMGANIHSLELENSLNELSSFLDNGAISSYHFSSLVSAEQPMPLFSPESITLPPEMGPGNHLTPQL